MKIAATFWGTQTYLDFLPQWYGRLEKYFVPGIEKHYFVFTDGELEGNVDDYYWLVSVDADLYTQEEILYEDFFDDSKKYMGVHHPCHYVGFPPHNQHPGSYDTNPLSTACIDDSIIYMTVYYQ